ncbi:gastric triacylglycerol lipase-like isoform X1 [Dermacentor albipictus]|uniref:gastric triacylglycerol lipase-like isoform X1 n=1 Tax=Dermacentor albipictus TaxID=60249 RepID=UPI0038FD2BA0
MSLPRTFTWLFVVVSQATDILPAVSEDLELEARLTPCELVEYQGYPCETTYATTEDGYILQVDRVPYGIHENVSKPDRGNGTSIRHPVLLVPAVFTASDLYFLNFPWQSPGFLFADNGFDVWSMNTREAKTYTSHITLSQQDPEFWKFSFDEMGRYDVATCIDHVLNATGATKLTIVAFSQGVLANLVLHSVRPEYSEKVNLLVAYAPVANITHIEPPFRWLLPIIPILEVLLYPLTEAGYLGLSSGLRELISAACEIMGNLLCADTFTLTAFTSPEQLNQAKPPPYSLERIRVPIALFPSPGDTVATPADVSDLVDTLGKNVIFEHVVPVPTFHHMDFAIGYRANDILHNVAIELMRKYALEGL